MPRGRLLSKPPNAQAVAPAAAAVLQQATQQETSETDVYLKSIGTAIDPTTNANFVTMRLRVNGIPFYPYDNMTSQIAPTSQPRAVSPPVYLGRNVAVDVRAEIAAGAAGNTTCAAGFDLLLMKPGERPDDAL